MQVHQSTALTLAIQDGSDAGQTVEHIHIHLLPRRPGDFKNNDDVYEKVSYKAGYVVISSVGRWLGNETKYVSLLS